MKENWDIKMKNGSQIVKQGKGDFMRGPTLTEEDLKRVNQHKESWFRSDGETLYTHKDGGLDGIRCHQKFPSFVSIRVALTWDSVTCPDCLKLKEAWEPNTIVIDTRGD